MKCARCEKEGNTHSLSFLNMDMICLECEEKEKEHPLYQAARDVEFEQLQKGLQSIGDEQNKFLNYPGLFAGITWSEIEQITTIEQLNQLKIATKKQKGSV